MKRVIYRRVFFISDFSPVSYAWSVPLCERKNRNLVIYWVSCVGSSLESSSSSGEGILRLLLKLIGQKGILYKSLDPTLATENEKMLTFEILRSRWIIMLWTDSSNKIVHSVIPIVKILLERVERYSPSGFHVYSAECFAIL
jgi:hypothetical protein